MKKYCNLLKLLFAALLVASMNACDTQTTEYKRGKKPSLEGSGEPSAVSLRSRNETAQGNMMLARVWDTPFKDVMYCSLDRPAGETVSVTVDVDNSLVELYNQEHGLEGTAQAFKVFPSENVAISGDRQMTAEGDKKESSEITITIVSDGIDALLPEKYLLPVTIKSVSGASEGNNVLYYAVDVVYDEPREIKGDFAPVYVGYINTEKVKPELANQFHVLGLDILTFEESYYKFFDIVNLNVSQVKYDAANRRPVLFLNTDISYVLNHSEKYIKPVQDEQREVCLVIKGGNEGIGFCNFTDAQTEDFVYQVKAVVEKAGLDGVNLWDEGSGYGKAGMPPVNATSYAKFIKALRVAMPDKLITLVDVGEPTANFDKEIAGIRVGELIDYAWHYYLLECVNPWKDGEKRKPIAGLQKSQYGGIILPILAMNGTEYATTTSDVKNLLIDEGLDKVFVFNDIPPFTHTMESETSGGVYTFLVAELYDTADWETMMGEIFGVSHTAKFGEGGYTGNIWEKDW